MKKQERLIRLTYIYLHLHTHLKKEKLNILTLQLLKQEMKKENAELTREAMGPVLEVVAEIAKKEGFAAIFEKGRSGLLFTDPDVDLTDKVIERLDEKN